MGKARRRASVSMTRDAYEGLRSYCERNDVSIAGQVELWVREKLGMPPIDIENFARGRACSVGAKVRERMVVEREEEAREALQAWRGQF